MTCVYDSLIKYLKNEDLIKISNKVNPTPKELIKSLKDQNYFTMNVLHQGKELSIREIKENYVTFGSVDINKLGNGYLVSGCEPLFLLIVYILKIRIEHNYNGAMIVYEPSYRLGKVRYKIRLNSSRTHMY